MYLVKTTWEARWRCYDTYGSLGKQERREFDGETAEPECRIFAMQQALENGKTNKDDPYTEVEVYEVEQHEARRTTYTRNGVTSTLKTVPTEGND